MIFVANRSTPTATKAFSGRRVCPTNEKCSLTPVMRVFSQNSPLQERTRHHEHQQPRRVQHRVSLVHVILLRQPVVETQIEWRIADDDVETLTGIVLPDVAHCVDMGIGIEVAGDGDRLRIDVEAVDVMQVRQVVEEIAHAAAHVQHHLDVVGASSSTICRHTSCGVKN